MKSGWDERVTGGELAAHPRDGVFGDRKRGRGGARAFGLPSEEAGPDRNGREVRQKISFFRTAKRTISAVLWSPSFCMRLDRWVSAV